jgi:hypothetical protein
MNSHIQPFKDLFALEFLLAFIFKGGNETAGIPLLANGEDWRQALTVRVQ